MWLFSGFVGLTLLCYSRAHFGDLVVKTASGTVNGWERLSRDGRVYQAWTGIPYAEPPVGKLRFMPPKAKSPWDGVLNATGDAAVCLQANQMNPQELLGSEDCLYLNVYRPKINKEKMPVLVYVHGGAFEYGSMGPRENADYLMDEDVVFVAIQYRLNAFGFMALGDAVMPGNFGLKDQVLALKWVKQNIALFGGNPNSVTVFGESAGGASTHILLKSPATDDLVHRAVSDSGSINRFWSLLKSDSVRKSSLALAETCGCTGAYTNDILKCMQKVDGKVILTNVVESKKKHPGTGIMPVIEPVDAVDPVATFDLSLRPSKKPWMTSLSTGEWILFSLVNMKQQLPRDLRQYFADFLSKQPIGKSATDIVGAADVLEKFYVTGTEPVAIEASKLEADLIFFYPAMANIALHKGPKWIYRFEYVDEFSALVNNMLNITVNRVASHAAPAFSYLNHRSNNPALGLVEKPQDREVSKRMIKYLVNFAYHEDPTPDPSPFKWKQFDDNGILRVTGQGDVLADDDFRQQLEDLYAVWDTVIGWKHT